MPYRVSESDSPPTSPDTLREISTLTWTDLDGKVWDIALQSDRILMRSDSDEIELKRENWARDLYAARHGHDLLIRVETFDCAARFVVSEEQAAPFIQHVSPQSPAEPQRNEAKPEPAPDQRLLWPRVSALAVWALILSPLSFLPVVGWVTSIGVIILLVLHRARVRHALAWRHSRVLCRYAAVFMVFGLAVSFLAVWGIQQNDVPEMSAVAAPEESGYTSVGLIAGALFVVLLSLTVHEAAHAITAWWLGDNLAHSQGRVTLNPLAHIDPFGTVLLPLILAFFHGPVFGYARPVPVRVEGLPRHRRAHILISLAGPGSNLILAALSMALLIATGCLVRLIEPQASLMYLSSVDILTPVSGSGFALAPMVGALCTILKLNFFINTLLAIFNLIPIPPLDGSWVLEHLFPLQLGRFFAWIRPYGFLLFMGAIYYGLFDYLLKPVVLVLDPGLELLRASTGF